MKVLVIELNTGKEKIFKTIEDVSKKYDISVKRIKYQIETGNKWKGKVFDYID